MYGLNIIAISQIKPQLLKKLKSQNFCLL